MFYVFARHCLGTYIFTKKNENYAFLSFFSFGHFTPRRRALDDKCPFVTLYGLNKIRGTLKMLSNFSAFAIFFSLHSVYLISSTPLEDVYLNISVYFILFILVYLGKKLFQH